MQAAQAFGLCPGSWRAQSVDDRARMMAHVMLSATREAYMAERIKKRAEKDAAAVGAGKAGGRGRPAGTTGMNAYEAQRAAMRARAGLAAGKPE